MKPSLRTVLGAVLFFSAGATALAGAHTWDFAEVFRNADGTIWFIETLEPTAAGMGAETGIGNLPIATLAVPADNFMICIQTDGTPACGLPPGTITGQKRLLYATAGYAELAAAQGAPSPDQIVNINSFFNTTGDTLRYNTGSPTYDTWAIPGTVPTDGVNSTNRTGGILPNSPRNWAGATGSVNASTLPPSVVPETMTVAKLDPTGSSLRVTFNVNACILNNNHNIVYGEGSDLPAGAGGTFTPGGGVCGIGGTSPYVWNLTPVAADGSGLIWFVIVVSNNPTIEGSWGHDSADDERVGPGPGGASLECGVTTKNLSNACGS